jgi:hypothetical protein
METIASLTARIRNYEFARSKLLPSGCIRRRSY